MRNAPQTGNEQGVDLLEELHVRLTTDFTAPLDFVFPSTTDSRKAVAVAQEVTREVPRR